MSIYTRTFMSCFTAPDSYKNKLSLWDDSLHSVGVWQHTRALTRTYTHNTTHAHTPPPPAQGLFLSNLPCPALEHGQAKAHFSRGDALSSRGVHMKEQQNIKECPRIHCSAQCEDNLALMENLDQRPGLHNCTFPNELSATEWARPPDSWDPFLCADTQAATSSFHLAMFSISMPRAKRLEKFFHSRSAHDFPLNVKILAEAAPGGPALAACFLSCPRSPSHGCCHGEKCEESPSDAPHLSLLSPEMNLCSQRANIYKNTSVFLITEASHNWVTASRW